jgi:hypothetical protein
VATRRVVSPVLCTCTTVVAESVKDWYTGLQGVSAERRGFALTMWRSAGGLGNDLQASQGMLAGRREEGIE